MSGTGAGIGLDLVEIERFRAVLDRRPRIAERLFCEHERAAAARRADPVPSLAARFAAKEAVMKALGVGLGAFDFAEVCVHRLESGAPRLELTGRAAQLVALLGVEFLDVSLSHTTKMAGAVVVSR
ncbi:MAG: holo-ACP synthase [Actinomycetota bacterium]|nr:holo-ACP synthase [Actinomycetota bacterium]